MMDLSVVPYGETVRSKAELGGGGGGGRYRECMRNHAAAIGGQAYDGCGEFMPGGEAGSLEALKCAACGCHRNFHRRDGGDRPRPLLLAWNGKNSIPPPPPPPGFPPFFPPPMPFHQIPPPPPPSAFHQSLDPNRVGSETPPRREEAMTDGGERSAMRKRHRTKFTAEQKEKMQAFAEKLGWRIQKHDDAALEEFCVEIGVKRHVLKVWMHNNKNHLSSPVPISTTATAPSATSNGDPAAAPPISV